MAIFTVTYANGDQEVLTADSCQESGEWLIFTAPGSELVRLRAGTVRRVDRSNQPGPGWFCRWAGCALLWGAAVFSLYYGGRDVLDAELVSGRMFGVALVVASCVWIIGGAWLLDGSRNRLRWALLGALAAAIVSAVLIGLQVVDGGGDIRVTVWLAVAFIAAALLSARLLEAGVRLNVSTRLWAAAAVAIGFLPFWYDKAYEPATRDAGLSPAVELAISQGHESATLPRYVTAAVTLKNISGTEVRILDTHYNVWNFEPQESDNTAVRSDDTSVDNGESLTFVRNGDLGIPAGFPMSPDQEWTKTIVLPIPDRAALPSIRFDLEIYAVKGARVPDADPDECSDDDCLVAWRIQESSHVNELLREPRFAVVVAHTEEVVMPGKVEPTDEATIWLDPCISRHADGCRDRNRNLDEPYGVMVIRASAEMAL